MGLFIIGDNLTLCVGQLVRAAARQITCVGQHSWGKEAKPQLMYTEMKVIRQIAQVWFTDRETSLCILFLSTELGSWPGHLLTQKKTLYHRPACAWTASLFWGVKGSWAPSKIETWDDVEGTQENLEEESCGSFSPFSAFVWVWNNLLKMVVFHTCLLPP